MDNTVLSHATTHETAWIYSGSLDCGNQAVNMGYAARINVYPKDSNTREYKDITFLPGLIALAQKGLVRFHTSSELQFERWHQPMGRFRGYGDFDFNLFSKEKIDSIDGFTVPHLGPHWMDLPTVQDQQRKRLSEKAEADPDYASLVAVLGPKNSQDAWHIRTAETHGAFCFLTMDYRLLDTIDAQKNAKRIKNLKTKVMSPEALGRHIGIIPIAPHIFSYTSASFPVLPEASWPDGKRRGQGKKG